MVKLKALHNDEIWPGSYCNFPAWPPQQQLTACLVSSLRSYAAGKGPQDEIIAEKTDGLLSDPPSSEGLRIHPLPQGQEGASLPVDSAHLLFMKGQSCHSGPSPASQSFHLYNRTSSAFHPFWTGQQLSQESPLEWACFSFPFLERKRGSGVMRTGSLSLGPCPSKIQEREGSWPHHTRCLKLEVWHRSVFIGLTSHCSICPAPQWPLHLP